MFSRIFFILQDIIPADLDLEGELSLEMEVEGVESDRTVSVEPARTKEGTPPTMELGGVQKP